MMFDSGSQLSNILESHIPVSFFGERRDRVKLLSVDRNKGTISSDTFSNLHEYLEPGDLLVVNNSRIVKAQLSAYFPELNEYGYIHVGTSRKDGLVLVEPRPKKLGRKLREHETASIVGPDINVKLESRHEVYDRYWWTDFGISERGLNNIMNDYGRPITYDHVSFPIDSEYYETLFSKVPGSVEPPSAGFPFTDDILENIARKGVDIAEITLHCNLGSLEKFEFETESSLLDENYSIPYSTIEKINDVKKKGGRVIAVGTTVVRALESYFAENHKQVQGECHVKGKTSIFIREGFEFNVVDALITGMHDDESSHIDMISAMVGPELLDTAYGLAVDWGYLWHEFGDITIIT